MVVSKVSELFSPSLKRFASPRSLQDRMILAAQSLTALKNSPPAPDVLHTVGVASRSFPQELPHFTSPKFSLTTAGLDSGLESHSISTDIVGTVSGMV
jgi:hypothetical protein